MVYCIVNRYFWLSLFNETFYMDSFKECSIFTWKITWCYLSFCLFLLLLVVSEFWRLLLCYLGTQIYYGFFFFLFFFFICGGFCHTLKWNSQGFTCVPHPNPPSHLPLHPVPLGFPRAPGPSTCLMHPTWAGDLFHPR